MDCLDILYKEETYSTLPDEYFTEEDYGITQHLQFCLPPMEQPEKFVKETLKSSSEGCDVLDFKKGTTTLAFVFKEGLLVAVDSRASMGSFIASQTCRKVLEINDRLLGTIAGGAADCSFWGRHLGRLCRLYELQNQERISTAAASNLLANIFFQYRGYGLSCGMMIAGYSLTKNEGELYYVDDSGARILGNLFSIGSGSTYAYGVLDSEYSYDLTLHEAIELGRRAIYHATYRDGGSGGVVRIYHVHKDGWTKIEEGQDVSELHYQFAKQKGLEPDIM